MIEDIKHWDGTNKFKEGYLHGLDHFSWLFPEIYEDPKNHGSSFIAGYKRGRQRATMNQLITGKPHV